MKKTSLAALLSVGLLLIFGCKTTKMAMPAKVPASSVGPTENALFWKVSAPGVKKPSYLYGTIHMIPSKDYSMPAPVRQAFAETKCLTTEIDLADMFGLGTMLSLITKANMKGGKTLKTLLSADDYKLVRAKMEEKGLPANMFERMKPMFTSMMLGDAGGGQEGIKSGATTSVEMELYELAKNNGMKTDGLESVDYQLSVFDSIPYDVQAKMLVESLKSGDGGSAEFDKMVKLYLSQDIGAMSTEAMGDDFSEYADLLLNNRNANWIPRIGEQLRERPTIFAVGAGHLGGPKGVVRLLRLAGWTVEPIRF